MADSMSVMWMKDMYKYSVVTIITQYLAQYLKPDKTNYKASNIAPMKLITRWLLLAAALIFVTYLYDGVTLNGYQAALIAAFVIGLLNIFVKPLLVILTLPVTVITVGLFLFVINALMFWAAASVLDGFSVTGFKAALIGSLMYSVLSYLINTALDSVFSKK
jgi:putative membrane protein